MPRRKRNARRRQHKPDEQFSLGPFRVARFGKDVVWRADWQPSEFEAFQRRAAEKYPEIVRQIDDLVDQIISLVAVLPPEQLLLRAWWEKLHTGLTVETEADVGSAHLLAARMVDYIQSMIAAVPRDKTQKPDLEEDDWQSLKTSVEALFNTLNTDYHICSAARNRLSNPQLDRHLEEFHFLAQLHWCNVTGQRYQNHQVEALADLLMPQSEIIQECLGITSQDLMDGLAKIWHSQVFGLHEAFIQLDNLTQSALKKMEGDRGEGILQSDSDQSQLVTTALESSGLEGLAARAARQIFSLDLFDLEKVTRLPESVLVELSWRPGEETEFLEEGPFKGWPLRIWPIFKRPFISIAGRYYCFDATSLFDHIYRKLEKTVFAVGEEVKQRWVATRTELSEGLPRAFFARLLPGARMFERVYYQWGSDRGHKKVWRETDLLVEYDEHLFVVEVKAGAFTYTSPATDFPAHVESLKSLLETPTLQGRHFVDYLRSEARVAIYDKDRKEVATLRRSAFRHIVICVATLDPFSELAAQGRHLEKLGLDFGARHVWFLSLDDLRVFRDIFNTPLEFLHYVEHRMRAFEADHLQLDDELDHLGLYFEHNQYSTYRADVIGKGSRLQFVGYRSRIDRYFAAKLAGDKSASPLSQRMPKRLSKIIKWLSSSDKPGRSKMASYLLDGDDSVRHVVVDHIETSLRTQSKTSGPRPLSTYGEVRLTAFVWVQSVVPRDEEYALDHARAAMLLADETDRFLMEVTYTKAGELVDLEWRTVEVATLSSRELSRLEKLAERIRVRRIEKAERASGGVGRNDECPCGSRKKYKKCCLKRRA